MERIGRRGVLRRRWEGLSWWERLSRRARAVVTVALTLVVLAVAVVSAAAWEPSSVAGTTSAGKVVVFAMPRLALADLGTGAAPNLDRLVREGAVAATSVRTVAVRPSTVEAYASLGAGARVRARGPAEDAYTATEKIGPTTARQLAALRTGRTVRGDVVVIGMAETIRANESKFRPSLPGALGDALQAAGRKTAVVGNSDTGLVEVDKAAVEHRPAAVAVADGSGAVDLGTVSPDLLRVDTTYPFGVRVAAGKFLTAARAAIAGADVVVLDPGELDRVFAIKATTTEERFETLRLRALRDTDTLLGGVVRALPDDALLIVTAPRPPTSTAELTPTVLWGAGVGHGYLVSPSTQRLGLVTITDLAPTVLGALGIPRPEGMIGHPLRQHRVEGATRLGVLEDQNDAAVHRDEIYLGMAKSFVWFQALAYAVVAMLFSSRRTGGRATAWSVRVLLGITAWPLATFVFRLVPHGWVLGGAAPFVVVLLAAVMVWAAGRSPRHEHSALSRLSFATLAVVALDLFTGAHLQQSSVLGYSPLAAARFTGIGNAAFAVLAASTILWACLHVQHATRRSDALLRVAAVCLVVLVADGGPMFGSDVGGLLTLAPVFGLLLLALSGRRVRARTVVVAAGVMVVAIAVATGLDFLRAPDSRTHLARFVSDVVDGGGQDMVGTTFGRKLSTNLRLLSGSFWRLMIPILAGVLIYFLVFRRGWEHELRDRALRVALLAGLGCGVLGFALNDSGVMVFALVASYLAAFVGIVALQHDARERARTSATASDDGVRDVGSAHDAVVSTA